MSASLSYGLSDSVNYIGIDYLYAQMALTLKQTRFYQSLCDSSSREVGIELFFDASMRHNAYRLIMGTEKSVPTWGTSNVFAHTHPKTSVKNNEGPMPKYLPPSSVDYHRALWDYFAGIEWSIVFESQGAWAYRPNKELVDLMMVVDPDVRSHITKRQTKMTYRGSSVTYMMKLFDDLNETLLRNVAIDNAHLALGQIDVAKYIENVGLCIDGEKRGFEVRYCATEDYKGLQLPGLSASDISIPNDDGETFRIWEPTILQPCIDKTLTYSWVSKAKSC